MALGPFGNRIPSLTFEVEADAGAVVVGAMLGEVSGEHVANRRERFANALNFRGEPHLPGVDLLTRYPAE